MAASKDKNSKGGRRKRNAGYNDTLEDATSGKLFLNEKTKKRSLKQMNPIILWPTIFILYTFTILFLHKVKYDKYPQPKYSTDHSQKDQFFENEARKHLLKLCSFGPKPAGSVANEVHAVQYILKQINTIKQISYNHSTINTLTVDVQKVSGAFLLENFVRTSYYSVYENLQNVVAKLEPPNTSESSLLINCHFDSVIDSPGAGDNTASCAVMLELMRALYLSAEPLKHSIIFLFNGAEENILQASHGFITQHPWAPSIKTFINLDSAGAGGWEIVFQTGPEHPWLVRAYAESAIYPYGSIVGQELFQSGVIPSDTDYRIFRDFGNLAGLDIAYIANGYIYHTQNDKPEYIPTGSIQRAGDNLLSVVRHLCFSDKLEDPGADKHGAMVFYDVVGLFMIHYPNRIGAVINSGFVALAFITLLLKYKVKIKRLIAYQDVSTDKTLIQAIGASLVCWILVCVLAAIVGLLIDAVGQPMFWFTRNYNIILIFGILSLTAILMFHYKLKISIYKYTPHWYIESLYYDAALVTCSVLTAVLTYNGLGSAYLPMLWVIFPFLSRYVVLPFLNYDTAQGPTTLFVLVTLLGQLFPLITGLHSLESVFTLFIPIAGRAGTGSYPDLIIGVAAAFTVVVCVQYLVGLVYLCSDLKPLLYTLSVIFFSSLIVTQLTSFGFPYSGNVERPTPQRALIFHIERNFYDFDGRKNKTDSGIWNLPFDQNSVRYLKDNQVIKASKYLECEGNYCGLPYMYPLIHVVDARNSFYTLKPAPVIISNPIVVKLTEKLVVKAVPTIIRYHFDVTGPDHMTIFVTPIPGAEMTRWSITNDSTHLPTTLPSGITGTTYYIYYAYGIKPDKPWHFWVDIKAPRGHKEENHLVDIAFNGHYISGKAKTSPELEEFRASLPDWVVPMSWICTYNSYLF